jgi:Macrocin-O-methyltransferase (TylF)
MSNRDNLIDLYLDLLEKALTGSILDDLGYRPAQNRPLYRHYNEQVRRAGLDWPSHAHTMIGTDRLRHLRYLMDDVLDRNVPGDFIEAGVWRGGACIYMRAVLAVRGVIDRKVWLADSFAGLPPPDAEKFPADEDSWLHQVDFLAVSLEDVKRNFKKYNFLDDQIVFLKGWFKDTLPNIPSEQRFAVVRLDGDLYESTTQSLSALYPKLSPRGFVVIDDYALPSCRRAVHDFREANHIKDSIERIAGGAVFWCKTSDAT